MSWFSTGDSAEKRVDQEVARQEEKRKEAQKNFINRWWMRVTGANEDGRLVTFLDAEETPFGYQMPFTFLEHNLKLNGHWRNWFTCIHGLKHPDTGMKMVCPICEADNRPSLCSAFTVIDHSSWTDKKGNEHKDEKKLFVAKTKVHRILRKAAKKKGGLRGWRVEITRASSESPNTGDVFDFEEKTEIPNTEEFQPYNYGEVFKPKTDEELQRILSGNVEADDGHVDFSGSDDDDIPF